MGRNPRCDGSGSWHNVMNRGIARRMVFERRADVRYFLSRVARAVRRIQNEYVRWFNRCRRRDGPLFRGRFRSKPVDSLIYRYVLVRYLDAAQGRARGSDASRSPRLRGGMRGWGHRASTWPQVRAALLRDLAGLTSTQIGLRLGCSEGSVSRLRARHRSSMRDSEHAERVEAIAVAALRASEMGGGSGVGRRLS